VQGWVALHVAVNDLVDPVKFSFDVTLSIEQSLGQQDLTVPGDEAFFGPQDRKRGEAQAVSDHPTKRTNAGVGGLAGKIE
jgi:hypothetical protein